MSGIGNISYDPTIDDYTGVLQTALDDSIEVCLDPGTYPIVNGKIKLRKPGQFLGGSGRNNTQLLINGNPNYLFDFKSGEPAATLEDFAMRCKHNNNAVTMIKAIGQPRFELRKLKLANSKYGVIMTGNSGGAIIDDMQMSISKTGIIIDGCLDSVYLSKLHVWPFNMNFDRFKDSLALDVGRMDNLHITDALFINQGVIVRTSAGVDLTSCAFDHHAKLKLLGFSSVRMNGGYFSVGVDNSRSPIIQTMGNLSLLGTEFWVAGLNEPLIQVSSEDGHLRQTFKMSNCSLNTMRNDHPSIYAKGNSQFTPNIFITDNYFFRDHSINAKEPFIKLRDGVRGVIKNNVSRDAGTNRNYFIDVEKDDFLIVKDNISPGYRNKFPDVMNRMKIGDNI